MRELKSLILGQDGQLRGRQSALVAMYHWGVLVRTRLHGLCECPPAGLAAVPLRRGAPDHSAGGPDRSPLLFASDLAVMFKLWAQGSFPAGTAVVPIALWEVSLGIYLVVKGFKPSPIIAGMTATNTRTAAYPNAGV